MPNLTKGAIGELRLTEKRDRRYTVEDPQAFSIEPLKKLIVRFSLVCWEDPVIRVLRIILTVRAEALTYSWEYSFRIFSVFGNRL